MPTARLTSTPEKNWIIKVIRIKTIKTKAAIKKKKS